LNLKLINHEHRKLAGHLIDEIGPATQIFFLESPPARWRFTTSPATRANPPTWWAGGELRPVAIGDAGLLFAWGRVPIFSLAQPVAAPTPGGFGQHVAAAGRLLEATRDERYASGGWRFIIKPFAVIARSRLHSDPKVSLRCVPTGGATLQRCLPNVSSFDIRRSVVTHHWRRYHRVEGDDQFRHAEDR
jgi:hypothetical protein